MADWRRFAEMLGAGAGAGIGGYQGAQGQNQNTLMQALQQVMQQKQFERQGQWHADEMAMQLKRLAEQRRQFDVKGDRDLLRYNLNKEKNDVYGSGGMSQSAIQGRMLYDLLQNPGLINQVPYSNIFGPNPTDPNLAQNRELDQKVKIDAILQKIIAANSQREGNNYYNMGGTAEDWQSGNVSPMLSTGFLGLGAGKPNPAYQAQQNYNFWNMSNPVAVDSAAALGGIAGMPQYQKFYGNKNQGGADMLTMAMKRQSAIKSLRQTYGAKLDSLPPDKLELLIRDEMAQ